MFTVAIDAKGINLSESIAEENQRLLIGRAKIRALMAEREDDRFFDQRNARREQAQTFDMSTPERDRDHGRARSSSPRRRALERCEIGSQASVTTADVGIQSDITLPHRIPALWHFQVPTSVIDMTPAQIVEAADDGHDRDEVSSESRIFEHRSNTFALAAEREDEVATERVPYNDDQESTSSTESRIFEHRSNTFALAAERTRTSTWPNIDVPDFHGLQSAGGPL